MLTAMQCYGNIMVDKITETELRDCYYIYRAMHDGVCPRCGHHGPGEAFESYEGALYCPEIVCGFYITKYEVQAITKRSNEILKRRLVSFEKVRVAL